MSAYLFYTDMNNLIAKYNHPNTLLVISSFPLRGQKYSQNQDAIAWYIHNRLDSLKRYNNLKTVVFTHIDTKPEIYEDGNSLVIRCLKRNSPSSWLSLLKNLLKFKSSSNILIEFEFATFGGIHTTFLFPLLLLAIKLLNKKITLELHQTLLDLSKLSGHIGQKRNSLYTKFMSQGLKLFYFVTGKLADNIIVLEEELKNRLKLLVSEKKITTITLGTSPTSKKINKTTAKKKLNLPIDDFLVLNFGFLTWYKGSDLAAEAMNHISSKKIKLILGGGPSFTQKNKLHYQRFLKRIETNVNDNNKVVTTGFIAEELIPYYFSAADLVILPYRTFMSSSGPLSLAISYGKPVLLGESLKGYLTSKDFKLALSTTNLKSSDVFTSIKPEKLAKSIIASKKSQKLFKLAKFSKSLQSYRNFDGQAEAYFNVFIDHSKSIDLNINPNLSVN